MTTPKPTPTLMEDLKLVAETNDGFWTVKTDSAIDRLRAALERLESYDSAYVQGRCGKSPIIPTTHKEPTT